jgi:hypothetical protein
MSMDDIAATVPSAYFHDDSGAVRFWVRVEGDTVVGASIGKSTLHYCLRSDISGVDALATYIAHHDLIDAAVRRRVAGGSIEPVMLREHDLPPAARS